MTDVQVKRDGYCLVRAITEEAIQPIVCIADVHLGHKNFNEKTLLRTIEYVKNNNVLWFGGGDLIENSNKNSVGAGWVEQVLGPQQQINKIVDFLYPIKEKCLGILNGNHEDRCFRDAGINPTEIIASMLGVPAAGDELFIIVSNNREKVGKGKAYTIYGAHTKTTNKTAGLAFNGMQTNMGWLNVDVICKAHGHDQGLSPPSIRVEVDKYNMAIVEKEQYFWLVGHYLDRPDSYISKTSKQPKPLGTVAIKLDMNASTKKRVTDERI
jgi:hypothetical protein